MCLAGTREYSHRTLASLASQCKTVWRMLASLASPRKTVRWMSASLASLPCTWVARTCQKAHKVCHFMYKKHILNVWNSLAYTCQICKTNQTWQICQILCNTRQTRLREYPIFIILAKLTSREYLFFRHTRQTRLVWIPIFDILAKLDSRESQYQHKMRRRCVREYSRHLQNLHLQNSRSSGHCLKKHKNN